MAQGRLKYFGWGREGEGMTPDEEAFALRVYRERFGVDEFPSVPVPTLARSSSARRASPRPWHSPGSAPPSGTTAPRTHSANPIRTPCAGC